MCTMLRLISLLAAIACASGAVDRTASIIPSYGALVGVSMDYGAYGGNISRYEAQLTRAPAAFVLFLWFPLRDWETEQAKPIFAQIGARKRIALVTLEPFDGLQAAQDPAALMKLSEQVLAWEQMGVTVIVRFAHEMNGAWYAWCQQPTMYRRTFALVAWAVTRLTKHATMLWAPNEGGGYPFNGGQYQLKCNETEFKTPTSECAQLDTNRDGVINMADDPYTPYYPGDDWVDWVGLSVYHFGSVYPWGANKVPERYKFYNKITGNYIGAAGDETGVPNFYDLFCNGTHGRSKPMIIGETAALYNSCDKGGRGCANCTSNVTELAIKSNWWRQVFGVTKTVLGPAIPEVFPQIKLINWFDIRKPEGEAENNIVDWTISSRPSHRNRFLDQVNRRYAGNTTPYWRLAVVPSTAATAAAVTISDADVATTEFELNKYTIVSG
ncbi:glycoside hydrolase superfamily [Scenedesmus sp. NREL 46B-D3]|nr:glycoside hydrolase superfamily [Scenedesmus sp. NREL 46B-D3]